MKGQAFEDLVFHLHLGNNNICSVMLWSFGLLLP